MAAITLPAVVGLFVLQVIAAVLRREPGGLVRAVVGVGKAMLGAALAIAVTQIALLAVDEICAFIAASANTTVTEAAARFLQLTWLAGPQAGPVLQILLGLALIAGFLLLWGVLLFRKAALMLVAVFAPIAFAGRRGTRPGCGRGGGSRSSPRWCSARSSSSWCSSSVPARSPAPVRASRGRVDTGVEPHFGFAVGPAGRSAVAGIAVFAPWLTWRFVHWSGMEAAAVMHGAVAAGLCPVPCGRRGPRPGSWRSPRPPRCSSAVPVVRPPAPVERAPQAVPRPGRGARPARSRHRRLRHPLLRRPRRAARSRPVSWSDLLGVPRTVTGHDRDAGDVGRFGRLERRGVLLGLDAGQLTVLAVALVVLVVAEYGAGALGVAVTAPVWGTLVAVALVSVAGRPVTRWLPIVGQWVLRRAFRATRYVARPLHATGLESLSLPGFPGRLTIAASPMTGAALVFDRRAGTVTGILELTGRGFLLEDPGSQDLRVAGWGRVLAALCQQPEIVRVQLLHRSSADGAAGVRRWWAEHALADAPWASRVVADLLAESTTLTDRRDCLLAVAVRVPRGSRLLDAAAVDAAEQHLAAITDALASAEVDVRGIVTPARLRRVLRTAYDPTTAVDGPPRGIGRRAGRSDGRGGVLGLRAHRLRAPRRVLGGGVAAQRRPPRVPAAAAPGPGGAPGLHPDRGAVVGGGGVAGDPTREGRAHRRRRPARPDRPGSRTSRPAPRRTISLRREHDLVAGHGDLRFTGLITVSADSRAELEAACRATEAAAAQAMCELRRLVGQQGQAHAAAALPLARGLL